MLEKVCAIFGIPAAVHSDNGPESANHIFEELCDFLNISISTSIPYFHQSNGVAERRNRDVIFTLRKLLADFNDFDNWSGYLPMTQLLINCQKCRRTGYTPFELIFGTESTIDPRSPPTKILDKLTNSTIPENSWLRTKAEANSNPPILPQSEDALHQFKEGSYVLRAFDRTAKLHSPWKGPYLVSKVYSNRNHVKLLNLLTGAETLCSIVALKPFNPQSTNPDYLSAIAAQDRAEHLVQEVQQIDTQRQRALVQWVGASEPTWEPLEEIRKTKAYSDFIKNQKSPKRSSPRKKK
ncbi:hypothetical protein GEMRC1_010292 [Eukaryota sp. GEM-RC1]